MELSALFSSPFVLLLTTLIVLGVLRLFFQAYHLFSYWKKRGIPYIPDSFKSFILLWKPFFRLISFTDFANALYYHHSDVRYFGSIDLATPTVILRDPELIKDVMVKEFEHFHDHQLFVSEDIDPLFGKNIFSLRGDRWREMRNTLSPSFTASKMKLMVELISKCAHEFVDYLVDHPDLCHSIETKQVFRRYTTDVIATAAFGISVNSMKEQNNEFYTKGVQATKFSNGFLSMVKFIFMRAFPQFSKSIGLSLFDPAVPEFFKRIVRETIKAREEQGIVRPDMIHLLMQARDKDGPSAHKMTLDDIVSQAFIFFFAGFDTSSTLMCFAVHELAVNPDIQERLRKEVEEHRDENGDITYDSLSKMTYMEMVVSETLRKYPPVAIIDRLCTKSYELPPAKPGYKSVIIEPDTVMMVPVYGLHHDPAYFPNPQKFDPERFNDENKDSMNPYTYLPFGLGPRKCIGNRFALMETKLLIAYLLQKFTFKTTEKTVEPVVFDKKEFTLVPDGGFWISLEKRI
ncbi:cytochrome P450 9e2-like [Pseudomyrmex gracilis]|uniref:cytochrome P450 9e2-like n=1 Tax=Pseudomyrmex gracilis TaxID=219809 RepID=UPI000995698B|nr:cytochrome P450 9e2-like [Pseudomyrmex gracilis]